MNRAAARSAVAGEHRCVETPGDPTPSCVRSSGAGRGSAVLGCGRHTGTGELERDDALPVSTVCEVRAAYEAGSPRRTARRSRRAREHPGGADGTFCNQMTCAATPRASASPRTVPLTRSAPTALGRAVRRLRLRDTAPRRRRRGDAGRRESAPTSNQPPLRPTGDLHPLLFTVLTASDSRSARALVACLLGVTSRRHARAPCVDGTSDNCTSTLPHRAEDVQRRRELTGAIARNRATDRPLERRIARATRPRTRRQRHARGHALACAAPPRGVANAAVRLCGALDASSRVFDRCPGDRGRAGVDRRSWDTYRVGSDRAGRRRRIARCALSNWTGGGNWPRRAPHGGSRGRRSRVVSGYDRFSAARAGGNTRPHVVVRVPGGRFREEATRGVIRELHGRSATPPPGLAPRRHRNVGGAHDHALAQPATRSVGTWRRRSPTGCDLPAP